MRSWLRMVVPQAFGYFHKPTACHADSKYTRAYVKGSAAIYVPRNWLCRVLDHKMTGPCVADNGGKLYTCNRCGYRMVIGGRLPILKGHGEKISKVKCVQIYESSHLFGGDHGSRKGR